MPALPWPHPQSGTGGEKHFFLSNYVASFSRTWALSIDISSFLHAQVKNLPTATIPEDVGDTPGSNCALVTKTKQNKTKQKPKIFHGAGKTKI